MSPQSRRVVLRYAGSALAGVSPVGAAGASRGGRVAGDDRPAGSDPTAANTDSYRTNQATPAVQFDAQQVADDGRRVTVERAVLPEGGFVAIHEGEPSGPILGVSDPLPAGTSRHVAVTLAGERRIVGRRELSAVLYRDEDGDGTFDVLRAEFGDDPYRVDGRPVHDTAVVFGPTPTGTVPPPPTPTPSATPSPTAPATVTATDADGAIPGFGVLTALVAAGVAAWRRG